MRLIRDKENKFEARRKCNKGKKIERKREGAERLRRVKGKRCMVLKKKRDSNQDISAYILPFLPRYLRAKSTGLADTAARSCILLLMASEMLINLPRVKQSTTWLFTDIANVLEH